MSSAVAVSVNKEVIFMENLYIVNEFEDYGENCYIVKADTIGKALYYFLERKRANGDTGYELKNNDEKRIEGVIRDEYGFPSNFCILPLEFDSTNVTYVGGYSE